ncbi:MAG TPA: TIGR00730 family Rossman fold protein [Candidatus Marinimicrobia bacterium]|jgi:hypothetical protein|nr:TIGR00730 family Rossman fold protein [Candidatus Neomarinimicrobiota bacterium]|tara:strand:- start:4912 stop:5475 length:564 start_codon:yes stop_codon:yes gene_type:complete
MIDSSSATIRKVCVYCAASIQCNQIYRDVAYEVGSLLAQNKISIVYGGSSVGSMGALADGAINMGGKITGILPGFLNTVERAHTGLDELIEVKDFHERKSKMIEGVDGVISLPGGLGTFEELMEAMMWKRLGLHPHPIFLVNTNNFFEPFVNLIDKAISERFIPQENIDLFHVVNSPEILISKLTSH